MGVAMKMNRDFFVHWVKAEGVIVLACVYCVTGPLY